MPFSVENLSHPGYLYSAIEEERHEHVMPGINVGTPNRPLARYSGSMPVYTWKDSELADNEMRYNVCIKINDQVLESKVFSNPNAFAEYSNTYLVSRPVFSPFYSSFVPARLDSIKHVAEDFFAPTTIHHTSGFHVSDWRELAKSLGALAWDLFTLPIRAVTLIPRWILLKPQEVHPLYQELHSHIPNVDLEKVEVHIQVDEKKNEPSIKGSFTASYDFYLNVADLHDYPERSSFYSTTKSQFEDPSRWS